jgi:hypothetical protein
MHKAFRVTRELAPGIFAKFLG